MAFRQLVEEEGPAYDYEMAGSVSEARDSLSTDRFDIIISDYCLADGTALEILDLAGNTPVIVVTGVGNEEIAVKAWRAGAYDYLTKDIDRSYLRALPIAVENAIQYRKAKEKLRLLSWAIMSTDEGIFITDMDDRIIFVNKAFCKTYGYEEAEILGKNSSILWISKIQNGSTRSVFRTQSVAGDWQIGFYHKRKDGSIFPVSLSRSIVKSAAGAQVAIVGTVRDITERLIVEEELRKANAKLKEQRRLKSSLAITVAQTLERLLANENLKCTEIQESNLCSALDAARWVVRDFLCLSKIDAGQLELQMSKCNLPSIVTEVIESLLPAANRSHVALRASGLDSEFPVQADRGRLMDALTNIISSEICSAATDGCIDIRLNDLGNEVVVSVQSTPAEGKTTEAKTDYVSTFVEQLDEGAPNDCSLALAVARELIVMHGGRFWVETKDKAESTCLCISLPRAGVHEMAHSTTATAGQRR